MLAKALLPESENFTNDKNSKTWSKFSTDRKIQKEKDTTETVSFTSGFRVHITE